MDFLADESCAGPVIRALRRAGHDVLAIVDVAGGSTDEKVMQRAIDERRVLITEDSDFGKLVYARGNPSPGIIFVKFHTRVRHSKPAAVLEAVKKLGDRLRGGFAVVEPGRVRLGKRPVT